MLPISSFWSRISPNMSLSFPVMALKLRAKPRNSPLRRIETVTSKSPAETSRRRVDDLAERPGHRPGQENGQDEGEERHEADDLQAGRRAGTAMSASKSFMK